ncbi:MAG: peptidyl-prolyl cis-trans isomerase [Elusimicrobia bacterium]|nr:peptidyl-prolyl cis-trans isomerase [Elusimicrobiota bacterium]
MKKQLIAALALVAVFAGGAQAAQKNVATVNGEKITADDLTKKLWWQHAAKDLSDLIDERLLLEEGARLGVKADKTEVDSRFAALQANYPDKAAFDKNLKSVGWSEKDLRNLIADQLVMRGTVVAAKNIAFTDDDVKAFFDANKDKLGSPEAVKLSQIFVPSKAEADDAYELLSTVGADFAKLSSLKSSDAALRKNAGALGFIARGMLQPDLEKEIFALKPGEYTKPIQTGAGYSIFKAEEIRPRQEASFDSVKADLKAAMINQAISQQLPVLVSELRKKAKIEISQQ